MKDDSARQKDNQDKIVTMIQIDLTVSVCIQATNIETVSDKSKRFLVAVSKLNICRLLSK